MPPETHVEGRLAYGWRSMDTESSGAYSPGSSPGTLERESKHKMGPAFSSPPLLTPGPTGGWRERVTVAISVMVTLEFSPLPRVCH